jgi:hypothetical protein
VDDSTSLLNAGTRVSQQSLPLSEKWCIIPLFS